MSCAVVVGCLAWPVGALAQEPPVAAEAEIAIDRANHFAARIGFGGPIGVAASVLLLHGLGADVRDGDDRVKATCAVPVKHCAGLGACRMSWRI